MRKLVLFDIDGTILWTDGAGRRAIRDALMVEMGTCGPIETFRLDGKTDPQIVRELLVAAGHPEAEDVDHISRVCQRYLELLAGELDAGHHRTHVFPGVELLISALEARRDTLVGLLTGNLAEGASLKLRAAGMDPGRFRVGAFGSDAPERAALPAIAARRSEAMMGRVPSGSEVVIIGDTPADMTCGQSIGARAIGVATGLYQRSDLVSAGAFAAFENLADLDPVLEAIVE